MLVGGARVVRLLVREAVEGQARVKMGRGVHHLVHLNKRKHLRNESKMKRSVGVEGEKDEFRHSLLTGARLGRHEPLCIGSG